MRDVAMAAGVSSSTVSHVLNGTRRVAPDTADRIRRAMEALDYQPDDTARSLRTRRSYTLSLLVSDISNPFFSALVKGVEDTAQASGFRLLICNTAEDVSKESAYIKSLLQRRVDGIIISPAGEESQAVEELLGRSVPCALVDRVVPRLAVDAVLSDNYAGAYEAVKYLLERGHVRIGVVLGLMHLSSTRERLAGHEAALRDRDLAPDPALLVQGKSCIDGGAAACNALLEMADPPTAIFTLNNLMTMGAAGVLLRHPKRRCPQDVSLIGFDDSPWADITNPPITTVAQDPYAIGAAACDLLLARLECGAAAPSKVVRIPTRLVERESVGSARPHKTPHGGKEVRGSEQAGSRRKAKPNR